MRLPATERFRDERERYRLRFTCEDCALFDAPRCSLGYPTDDHRATRYADADADLVFCKSFELV